MEQPLIRGVAPQMRDQAAYPTLGGGAGGRSPGSIFFASPRIAALYLPLYTVIIVTPGPAYTAPAYTAPTVASRPLYSYAPGYWGGYGWGGYGRWRAGYWWR
jgi:hypothetical protein